MSNEFNILKELQKTKLPTLLLIGAILVAAVTLIKDAERFDSPSFTSGIILLIVDLILVLISFVDYRNKEHMDKIVNYYQTALNDLGKTNSAYSRNQRENLKNSKLSSKTKFVNVTPGETDVS